MGEERDYHWGCTRRSEDDRTGPVGLRHDVRGGFQGFEERVSWRLLIWASWRSGYREGKRPIGDSTGRSCT
jgi:hypothetical protein